MLIWMITFCFCAVQAVLSGKELNRREAGFGNYGPPSRPQHGSSHEYGVPQHIPFREYGPPALKYDLSKLNFLGGGSGSSSGNRLHEQIKTHFGVPKPFYGPPHIHKPALHYRPLTTPKPVYGSPAQYGLPPQPPSKYGPAPQYGPPSLKLQHRPAPQYGLLKPQHLAPAQPLHAQHSDPLFKQAHQPATSYGPPASGPLSLPPKPVYDTPSNYGPPPLPVHLPRPQFTSPNTGPETTIILSESGGQKMPTGPSNGPVNQVQIQIDAFGHTHSVSGSQAPFQTACDGWKPIPAPPNSYIGHNQVETQGGYSSVYQAHSPSSVIQYNVGGMTGVDSGDGLSDEQLVAVALQSDGNDIAPDSDNDGHLNTIESEAIQGSVGLIDDSYSNHPADLFAPSYVPDSGPVSQSLSDIGPLPPRFAALTSDIQSHGHSHSNVNIQYGPPSKPFLKHSGGQPNSPVAYRPSVPTGLLESIGATVQHLDQFGVKPIQQAPTYIPPAVNEIAIRGQASPTPVYGAPVNQPLKPQIFVQQQLPQIQSGPTFGHQKPPHFQHLSGPQILPQPRKHYLPPPQPPVHQYLPAPRPTIYLHGQNQHQISQNTYSASQQSQQFIQSQGLPLPQQAPRFGGPYPQTQTVVVHDCGHGPNLVSSIGYQVKHQQQQSSVPASPPGAYNAIAQGTPVAEQHSQFLSGTADIYGPSPSGNDIEIDHTGYASQKSSVAALPDGTDSKQVPDLDGLNVISTQKSQSIQLGTFDEQSALKFQAQFGNLLNNAALNGNNAAVSGQYTGNHEEILSQGLLQSILTVIEQPQSTTTLPKNLKAQNRSDDHHQDNHKDQQNDEMQVQEQELSASNQIDVHELSNTNSSEYSVKRIKPIVAADVEDNIKH